MTVVAIDSRRRKKQRVGPRPPMRPVVQVAVGAIAIQPVADPGDQAFVVAMKRSYADEHGLPYVAWDNAMYFVARHRITGDRFGCMAVNQLAPLGHYFVGDFFTVKGVKGKIAALAMFEVLHGAGKPIMGLVARDNQRMQKAVLKYGYIPVAILYQRAGGEARV